ncbi:MAG: 2,3-bisphosphoglycerate-independent phosphoglycerate mutase [Akkermansiaceae bacterium]|nr:2,3-bisphosphoglycerate-independent phosphoglycerate mutase [Armatimonadota bacterium]
MLCILDGLGLNPNPVGNAVAQAETPCLDRLFREQPNATLITCGERVGLPDGQMGNSEVGHLNIGAGRVVEQWLLRINRALQGDFLAQSPAYRAFRENTRDSPALHLVGLFSDGGVHSHSDHLTLLLRRVAEDFPGTIYLHLITDGRDTSPQRAAEQIAELQGVLATLPAPGRCRIATVSGRFYVMDRDNRWERTERGFDAIVHGRGHAGADPVAWVEESYQNNTTDEFIEPAIFDYNGAGAEDGILFWNFRTDRMRQIVRALCVEEFDGFERKMPPFPPARTLTFTEYDPTFALPYLFPELTITSHLGEVIARQGLQQLRVAESEKYPHVTYFFNGGGETPYKEEVRRLVPSPRDVRTYDEKPEMSAPEVTKVVVEAVGSGEFGLIVVNFANCDMVGHTGVLEAAIRAVETVDGCLQRVLDALAAADGQAVIIADHGNAEQMIHYEDGTPHTAHTLFPVPIILVGAETGLTLRSGGALCDIAPTVLGLMGIPQPAEMTGSSLLVRADKEI